MFTIFDAWREIAHVAELTGVSVGVLVALAALAFFDPVSRGFVIRFGLIVIIIYACLMCGLHLGASDVRAQWDAANARAAAEAKARDDAAAKATADTFNPTIEARDKEIADLKLMVSQYEARLSKTHPCPLGSNALRLRDPRQPRHTAP